MNESKLLELRKIKELSLEGLKNFQRASAIRIFEQFKSGQKKVLLADEVGLGKTLIAKAIIAQVAEDNFIEGDRHFKVAYICSNQVIVRQNLNKLRLSGHDIVDRPDETRLSMQHLKVYQDKYDPKIRENYIQLIPLSPATSFHVSNGGGSVKERALIYVILRKIEKLKEFWDTYEHQLNRAFIMNADKGWKDELDRMEEKVKECDDRSQGEYLRMISEKAWKSIERDSLMERIKLLTCDEKRQHSTSIGSLRRMFAEIGIGMLDADLVIMDEFQRYRSLISADLGSDMRMLADMFLKSDQQRVLLLSATPFKLFSTLEEMDERINSDPYQEFTEVMEFLMGSRYLSEFRNIWGNYSSILRKPGTEVFYVLEAKQKAEKVMYSVICRTERNMAEENGLSLENGAELAVLNVCDKDVRSYLEAQSLASRINGMSEISVEYTKSCPFLLSFSAGYKLRKLIDEHREKVHIKHSDALLLSEEDISAYKPLASCNAKLEKLKKLAFEKNSERLLWVPPSLPYYEPQGPFAGTSGFSKILLFSSWIMVPRMIASLLSYEAERMTIGKMRGKNTDYWERKGAPKGLVNFKTQNNKKPESMYLFCLIYPSKTLASLFNPIDYLESGLNANEIEKILAEKISEKLKDTKLTNEFKGRNRNRWYYLAPLLLDSIDSKEWAPNWLKGVSQLTNVKLDTDTESEQSGINRDTGVDAHFEQLCEYYENIETADLGPYPDDLPQVLAKMALASPAVCYLRLKPQNIVYPTQFALKILQMFNLPESTVIVKQCYNRFRKLKHWRKVLQYCLDGNLQAMLDEYTHMLAEANGCTSEESKLDRIHDLLISTIKTHTSTYMIDSYESYLDLPSTIDRTIKTSNQQIHDLDSDNDVLKVKPRTKRKIRTHFAVGLNQSDGETIKTLDRKESIISSFNSPFRPFVLASTSIGQEGLDFHYYCRRIMHWNLPANPVEMEQREGRVNRYKCLSIRQKLAKESKASGLCKIASYDGDVWQKLFAWATDRYQTDKSQMAPFWFLPNSNDTGIERYVPVYPFSKDIPRYTRLLKILSLYRLTLGQTRQEELIDQLVESGWKHEELQGLFLNLSPFFRNKSNSNLNL